MQDETYETVGTDPVFKVVRAIVPWIALALVVWVLYGAWGRFSVNRAQAEAQKAAAAATTSTPAASPSAATTVTGMVAIARVAVTLRSEPEASSESLATAKKGATLTIMSKQGTFFRVKDKAGHIGWIANDSASITVRKKP
jgi:SH3-like domain-containing protein